MILLPPGRSVNTLMSMLLVCDISLANTKQNESPMETEIVPLVEFRDGGYVAREDTLAWLAEREQPFAVVTCAGKFRTGKSFLLNRLLERPPGKGFGVGETVQACTRGIWLCKKFISGSEGMDLLVCDTEGIDALDAESEHDVRVFALAVLMSSVFIYNSQSHLDEAAVQTLSLMTRIAERIGGEHDPHLYWVLRDFALQLADDHGKPMTHKEYLERSLSPCVADKCKTREAIKKIFKTRHLVTLPRPHKTDSAQKLDQKGSSAISAKFDKFLNTFRTHMMQNAFPVQANGVPMTGRVFSEYVKHLVSKLNEDGVVPKLEDSWSLIRQTQSMEIERQYRRTLMDKISTDCPSGEKEDIMRWIHSVPFVFPKFLEDSEIIAANVADEVYTACVAAGRVMKSHDLVRREVDILKTTFRNVDDETLDNYGRVAKYALEQGFEQGSCDTFATARQDCEMELLEKQNTIDSLREELQSLSRTPASSPLRKDFMDACVGTDDLQWTEPQTEVFMAVDSDHEVLKATLQEKHDEVSALSEDKEILRKRLETLKKVYDERMEELKASTNKIVNAMTKEANDLKETAQREARQKEALALECEKNRDLLRKAQEKALDVHRSMLEELRRRDTEGRTFNEEKRKEWSEMNVRLQLSENENRGMKRQLDDSKETETENKRLQTFIRQLELEKIRVETESSHMKTQVETFRQELVAMRRKNADLEGQVAVLEATSKLESCRRELVK